MIHIDYAKIVAKRVLSAIRTRYMYNAMIVGSIRRNKNNIKDIDILLTTRVFNANFMDSIYFIENKNLKISIVSGGERKLSILIDYYDVVIKCDIFYAAGQEIPFSVLHTTGSAQYNIRLRHLARLRGYKLNQYGLYDKNNNRITYRFKYDTDIIKFLGSERYAPEDRED